MRKYTLQIKLDEYEALLLHRELSERKWNISQTARALGISRKGLQNKMKELKVASPFDPWEYDHKKMRKIIAQYVGDFHADRP
jgi:hypothetical protein